MRSRPTNSANAWDGAKVDLPLLSFINGKPFGKPVCSVDMTFDFPALIVHAAKTRPLGAGTILGAGTVSNRDADGGPGKPISEGGLGYSCMAEIRTVETILHGKPSTPFLKFGDTVSIEMNDNDGRSIFGAIEQEVVRYTPPNRRCRTAGPQGEHGQGLCFDRRHCREENLVRRDRPRALCLHGARAIRTPASSLATTA